MAKLSTEKVKQIASLAHLKLSYKQIEKFRDELSLVLEYVDQLNRVDTSGVEPVSQVNDLENITREDNETPSQQLSQEHALSNAQESQDGYFVVERVI